MARGAGLTGAGLAALVGLAVLLRLVRIGADPLWFDEAATLAIASLRWEAVLGEVARAESSPAGYYALAKLWGAAFGEGVAALRVLSVLAGAGAVAALWWLARAGLGARAGWAAGLLLAVAGQHVRVSQDGRCYAVLFLVVVLAMMAGRGLALGAARGGGAGAAMLLGVAMAAGMWLHHTAGLAAVALNLFVVAALLAGGAGARRGLVLLAGADALALGLALLPLLAAWGLATDPGGYVDRWIAVPGLAEAAAVFRRGLVAAQLGPWAGMAAVAVAAGLLACAWGARREGLVAGAAAMLAGGAVLLVGASQVRPVLLERTALFLLAPLVVLLAAGVARLPARVGVGALVVLAGLWGLGVARFHGLEGRKEAWHGAAAMVAGGAVPVVVSEGPFAAVALRGHLGEGGRVLVLVPAARLDGVVMAGLAEAGRAPGEAVAPEGLCAALGGAGGAWLVSREVAEAVRGDPGFTRRPEARAALLAAGGRAEAAVALRGVVVERWAVPAC